MATLALALAERKPDHTATLMLGEAQAYARRGWLVIPLHTPTPSGCSCGRADCESHGKHPRTHHGLKEGTTDQDQILRWWRQCPEANIGILTGAESNICVLDVD